MLTASLAVLCGLLVLVLLVFLPDLLDDSGKKGKGKGAGEDPTAHN